MTLPSILDMLKAGVHFGHQTSRWHPKMKPFIFTQRHGVHIIDLEKTKQELESVLEQVKNMAAEGKQVLFISTKPQAREIVKQAAMDCGMPYLVERWIGGLLTNFPEIHKLINKYIDLKEKQATGALEKYTKKERLEIARNIEKMDVSLAGLVDLAKRPDAVFIPAVQREKTALVEANRTGVPIVGVCDTNANPNKVDFPIPANDDAVKAITLMVNLVRDAVNEGKALYQKKQDVTKKDVMKEDKKKPAEKKEAAAA